MQQLDDLVIINVEGSPTSTIQCSRFWGFRLAFFSEVEREYSNFGYLSEVGHLSISILTCLYSRTTCLDYRRYVYMCPNPNSMVHRDDMVNLLLYIGPHHFLIYSITASIISALRYWAYKSPHLGEKDNKRYAWSSLNANIEQILYCQLWRCEDFAMFSDCTVPLQ